MACSTRSESGGTSGVLGKEQDLCQGLFTTSENVSKWSDEMHA